MSGKVVTFSHELFKAVLAEYQKLLKLPYSRERNRALDRIRAEFLDVALYRALETSDSEAAFWSCYEMVYGGGQEQMPLGETVALLQANAAGGHVPSCWLLGTILTDTGGDIPDEFISHRQGTLLIARAARKGYAPAMTALLDLYRAQLSKTRYFSQKAYALARELAARDYPTGFLYLAECALQQDEPGPKGSDRAMEMYSRALETIGNLEFVDYNFENWIRRKAGNFFCDNGRRKEGMALLREVDLAAGGEGEQGDWLPGGFIPPVPDRPAPESQAAGRDVEVIRLNRPFSFQIARDKEREEKRARDLTPAEIEDILKPLDDLTGLSGVKKQMRELAGYARIVRQRRQAGLAEAPLGMHMVFSGNPGTGKTTTARIVGKVLADLGCLRTGNVIEVDRSGLVGEYIGETAQKTRRALANARGGVLFIDEAHTLVQPFQQRDFGWEAVDTLVKAMEDRRDDLVVIAAGTKEGIGTFLGANEGLASRFSWHIDFPDYGAPDMTAIIESMAASAEYRFSAEARDKLAAGIETMTRRPGKDFANGRTARRLFESILRAQADRLIRTGEQGREALSLILPEDIRFDRAVSDGSVTFLPGR